MSIAVLSTEEFLRERGRRYADAIVVDARRRRYFEHGHVPGSIWMGWETWCERAPDHAGPVLAKEGHWGVLIDAEPAWYAERLSSAGLSDDRPIVVYSDGVPSRGSEARIAWMLLYFGASEVYLLDGGWSAWLKQGGAVEVDTAAPRHGKFAVCLQPNRRRILSELKQAYHSGRLPTLVDTRSRAEFAGDGQEYLSRRGRLPSAMNVPFIDLFDPEGHFIGRERYLEQILRSLRLGDGAPELLPAEVRGAPELVAYCEVGVRASLFAMLHEAYTAQVVPVYDGSLVQWAHEVDLPMLAGEQGWEGSVSS